MRFVMLLALAVLVVVGVESAPYRKKESVRALSYNPYDNDDGYENDYKPAMNNYGYGNRGYGKLVIQNVNDNDNDNQEEMDSGNQAANYNGNLNEQLRSRSDSRYDINDRYGYGDDDMYEEEDDMYEEEEPYYRRRRL